MSLFIVFVFVGLIFAIVFLRLLLLPVCILSWNYLVMLNISVGAVVSVLFQSFGTSNFRLSVYMFLKTLECFSAGVYYKLYYYAVMFCHSPCVSLNFIHEDFEDVSFFYFVFPSCFRSFIQLPRELNYNLYRSLLLSFLLELFDFCYN